MRDSIVNNVARAEILINNEIQDINILDVSKEKDNILKIYTQAAKGMGRITNIRILNKDGDVIIEKPRNIEKNKNDGLISTFMLEIQEVEYSGNTSIFDLSEVK